MCLCVCLCVSGSLGPMDCSLPGSFVHGIFQARVLEWVPISFKVRRPVFWFFIFNLLWSWAVYFASLILDFLAFKLCLKVDFLCVTSLTLVFSGSISSVEIHWVIGRDVLSCNAQELQGTPLSLYSVWTVSPEHVPENLRYSVLGVPWSYTTVVGLSVWQGLLGNTKWWCWSFFSDLR